MQFKFATLKDFSSVWQNDFLGRKGFFLPGQQKLKMGQVLEAEVIVGEENWGKVKLTVVWHNLFGIAGELTPKGVFLLLSEAGGDFNRRTSGV